MQQTLKVSSGKWLGERMGININGILKSWDESKNMINDLIWEFRFQTEQKF